MLKSRIIALFSVFALSVLSACSDLNSVSLNPTSAALPSEVLQNIQQSGDGVLDAGIFGTQASTNMVNAFSGLAYTPAAIQALNFTYAVVETNFTTESGLTVAADGSVSGKVLPSSAIATPVTQTLDNCLGLISNVYNVRITDPSTGSSITKAFTVKKSCDGCGDLAPFVTYI